MFKTLSALLLISMLSFATKAQQATKDTTIYYMKNSGINVPDKDSADYVRYIMAVKSINGINYFPVMDTYLDGKQKMVGFTLNNSNDILLSGKCVRYYQNGNVKSVIIYQRGVPISDVTEYYPNGKLYFTGKFGSEERPYNQKLTNLSECRDSTGKVLAVNGEGQWLRYDDDFKNLIEEGPVTKGVEQGKWTLYIDGKPFYFTFTKGIITSPPQYELTGDIKSQPDILPVFREELGTFNRFIMYNVRYPREGFMNETGGKAVLSFVVELDGRLSNIKVVSASSKGFGETATDALRSSPPWRPAYVGDKPVRASYIYPFKFVFGEK